MLEEGTLTTGHAKAIMALTAARQISPTRYPVLLSVRETEAPSPDGEEEDGHARRSRDSSRPTGRTIRMSAPPKISSGSGSERR